MRKIGRLANGSETAAVPLPAEGGTALGPEASLETGLTRLFSLGIQYPVMQAGMPGVAEVELASAVARAGGIGTLGLLDVSVWEDRLAEARRRAAGKPINANLLLPYTRRRHLEAVLRQEIPLVTFFWGDAAKYLPELHRHGVFVFQQVGSQAEAAQALEAGVDALIVQGTEAGGHLRGRQPLSEVLPEVAAQSGAAPVFAAGGIYTADNVRRVVALGASGVSTGTRFLLTTESNAHPRYKERLLAARGTLVTTLFGLGWPAPHRVVPNAATDRWCAADGSIPSWLQAFNAGFGFTRKVAPMKPHAARMQRPGRPLFSPTAFVAELPDALLESTALYAGEHVARIGELATAESVVEELARGFGASASPSPP